MAQHLPQIVPGIEFVQGPLGASIPIFERLYHELVDNHGISMTIGLGQVARNISVDFPGANLRRFEVVWFYDFIQKIHSRLGSKCFCGFYSPSLESQLSSQGLSKVTGDSTYDSYSDRQENTHFDDVNTQIPLEVFPATSVGNTIPANQPGNYDESILTNSPAQSQWPTTEFNVQQYMQLDDVHFPQEMLDTEGPIYRPDGQEAITHLFPSTQPKNLDQSTGKHKECTSTPMRHSYHCSHCDYSSNSLQTLTQHMNRRHSGKPKIICHKCYSSLDSRKDNFRKHLRRSCEGMKGKKYNKEEVEAEVEVAFPIAKKKVCSDSIIRGNHRNTSGRATCKLPSNISQKQKDDSDNDDDSSEELPPSQPGNTGSTLSNFGSGISASNSAGESNSNSGASHPTGSVSNSYSNGINFSYGDWCWIVSYSGLDKYERQLCQYALEPHRKDQTFTSRREPKLKKLPHNKRRRLLDALDCQPYSIQRQLDAFYKIFISAIRDCFRTTSGRKDGSRMLHLVGLRRRIYHYLETRSDLVEIDLSPIISRRLGPPISEFKLDKLFYHFDPTVPHLITRGLGNQHVIDALRNLTHHTLSPLACELASIASKGQRNYNVTCCISVDTQGISTLRSPGNIRTATEGQAYGSFESYYLGPESSEDKGARLSCAYSSIQELTFPEWVAKYSRPYTKETLDLTVKGFGICLAIIVPSTEQSTEQNVAGSRKVFELRIVLKEEPCFLLNSSPVALDTSQSLEYAADTIEPPDETHSSGKTHPKQGCTSLPSLEGSESTRDTESILSNESVITAPKLLSNGCSVLIAAGAKAKPSPQLQQHLNQPIRDGPWTPPLVGISWKTRSRSRDKFKELTGEENLSKFPRNEFGTQHALSALPLTGYDIYSRPKLSEEEYTAQLTWQHEIEEDPVNWQSTKALLLYDIIRPSP